LACGHNHLARILEIDAQWLHYLNLSGSLLLQPVLSGLVVHRNLSLDGRVMPALFVLG
jgi:hypothetical protein